MLLAFSLKAQQLILLVMMLLSETRLISKLYVVKKGLAVTKTSCNHVKIIHRNFQLMELKVLTVVFFTLEQVEEDLSMGTGVIQEFDTVITILVIPFVTTMLNTK